MSPTYIALVDCAICKRAAKPLFKHAGELDEALIALAAGEVEPPCCGKPWRLHAIQRLGESCPEKRTVNPDHYRGPLTRLARKVIRKLFSPCPRLPYPPWIDDGVM